MLAATWRAAAAVANLRRAPARGSSALSCAHAGLRAAPPAAVDLDGARDLAGPRSASAPDGVQLRSGSRELRDRAGEAVRRCGERLGSALDQLDLDERLSALQKTLGSLADKVASPTARRCWASRSAGSAPTGEDRSPLTARGEAREGRRRGRGAGRSSWSASAAELGLEGCFATIAAEAGASKFGSALQGPDGPMDAAVQAVRPSHLGSARQRADASLHFSQLH
jgi:hypothetical protein